VSAQILSDDRIDLVIVSEEDLPQGVGQVLVELDFHPCGSRGISSSRARAAP
jgi:hypothetical protein